MSIVRQQGPGGASYSSLVEVDSIGRWIYISGQVAFGPEYGSATGTLAEQTETIFDQMEALLTDRGGELRDVIKLTVYIKDLGEYPAFSRLRAARFGAEPPASTAVGVSDLLLDADIEIDAVAFIAAVA